MTSSHPHAEEVGQDLPRPRIHLPRTSTHAGPRQAERPHTSPTIDQMLLEAREHRGRCEALLEALGAPVASGVVNTRSASKES